MKVLIVSQPGTDGVLRHVEGLVNYLLDHGTETHLAYSDFTSCDQLFALVNRVTAAGGQAINLRVANAPQPADFQAIGALRSFVRKEKPDVIHAHSSKAGALVRGLRLLGVRTPIFYTPHAYYRMHDPASRKARVFHAIERALGRIGTTITMSHCESHFAETVIGVPLSRQAVIANGVDCARFHPPLPEEKRTLREKYGIPPEAKVLGTVGRLSLQKDPLTTYGALKNALASAPDLFLLHVGRGELEPEVTAFIAEQGLADHCRRIPYLADPTPLYQMADGFIMASLYEGMSFAVLESLASDLPLVLTEAPGNIDFRDFSLSHLHWAKPADRDSVAAAMLAWRAQLERAEVCNHRAIALREFSLESCYSRVVAAYAAAVKP
ncbi:MAG TPA: glycosyltransferase family 4 protein [Chthoniobacteraceae bacterium]|jgi:glycosyltransferase involved in cell wall biosynthesis